MNDHLSPGSSTSPSLHRSFQTEPLSTEALIRQEIAASVAVQQGLLGEIGRCVEIAERLIEAYRAGRKVLLFGNGGSAADALHIAGELVGRFKFDRSPLPALALVDNSAALTAIGNDYGFDQLFARQVEALGSPGDVAIALSTSGNSPNVIAGVRTAKRKGLVTIGMTGADGGALKAEVDLCLCVPSRETPRIQEAHIVIGHIWCGLVERALFDPPHD